MSLLNFLKSKSKFKIEMNNVIIKDVDENILKKEINSFIKSKKKHTNNYFRLSIHIDFMQLIYDGKKFYLEYTLNANEIRGGGEEPMSIRLPNGKYLAFYDEKLNKEKVIEFYINFLNSKSDINSKQWCYVDKHHCEVGYTNEHKYNKNASLNEITEIIFYKQDRRVGKHGKMVAYNILKLPGIIYPNDLPRVLSDMNIHIDDSFIW